MKQRIVLLGPPASGKGTQAEMIQARYQFPITSPGAILREESKLGTALGIEAEKSTSQGQLAPDRIVNALIEAWLARHEDAFVFDGYPRSFGQATALEETLAKRGTKLDVVLSLEVDLATIRERVERRLICSRCGRIVSVGLHVTTSDAPCPACGSQMAKRGDDTPETLELRMREYADKTAPLIEHFQKHGLLHKVDARGLPEAVFASIVEILEEEA